MPDRNTLHNQTHLSFGGGEDSHRDKAENTIIEAMEKPGRVSAGPADNLQAAISQDVTPAAEGNRRFRVAPLALEPMSSSRYEVSGKGRQDRKTR